MKKNYDTLLLDADDTLLDFGKTEKAALENTFDEYGLKLTEEIRAIYKTINHELWSAFERGEITKETITSTRFSRVFDTVGYRVDGRTFHLDYQKALGRGYFLIDGARELCEKLAGKSRLYCVTNGVAATQYSRLSGSGLDNYFDNIFVSEEIGHQKPSRDYFSAVFKSIGQFDPSRTLIVGDSLTSDIQGGKNTGIDTCWYNPSGKIAEPALKADYDIRKLDELLPILEKSVAEIR